MPNIIVLGTFDTKGEQLLYIVNAIQQHKNMQVTVIDVGKTPILDPAIHVPSSLIAKYGSRNTPDIPDNDVGNLSRAELNKLMATGARTYVRSLFQQADTSPVHGMISLGGSFGTSLASSVMRLACPMGFPKLIVSTIASGDTGSIVGETDITLMYSIVDVAGLNSLLRNILDNAVGAIAGMATVYENSSLTLQKPINTAKKLVRVGITMFGVTTPCVDRIRAHLQSLSDREDSTYTIEPFVFHATGHGGRAMEHLITAGGLDAIIDLTTTEIADYVVGGVMSAGPTRLDAAIAAGIPMVLSVGATDIVNFGPCHTVPERFAKRKLYEHNSQVTLLRSSPEECTEIGRFIAEKLKSKGTRGLQSMVEVWLPKGGVSMISGRGEPFEDVKADEALFNAVRCGLSGTGIKIVESDCAINDEVFAVGVADALVKLLALD
ncbi:hypothetical protein BDP27DRAFT_1412629 [Rhodocollybia butyracea]|uniref:Uncharacterized protein n=1 Tax=Rhodocollybia butyracea TaxID=206335 RepID=A0A9P5QBC8_9AGAR|nr:hypothetical protein BDP27DRAFT_1412629 [Rhodocollybia butyracea]